MTCEVRHGASLDTNINPQNYHPLIKEDQYEYLSYELGRLFHHHHSAAGRHESLKAMTKVINSLASATSATSTDSLHSDEDGLLRFGTRFHVPDNKDLRLMVTRNAHHIIARHPG